MGLSMRKEAVALVLCMLLVHGVSVVSGIGLSPPQLRLENAPMGEQRAVASLIVSNTDSEPVYMILKISSLERTRESKLRVICTACRREIGIQRGDLVDGACPFCDATGDALIFYDFPPDDVLRNITLSSVDCPLEPYAGMYKTVEKVPVGRAIKVDITVSVPAQREYYGKHWEVRVMASSVRELDELSGFIIYGAEAKFLVDSQEWAETQEVAVSPVVITATVATVLSLILVPYSFFRRKAKKPARVALEGTPTVKPLKGRKLL